MRTLDDVLNADFRTAPTPEEVEHWRQERTTLEQRLADLERHNELLRAVADEMRDLLEDKTHFLDRDDIVYFTLDYVECAEMALQAAIDGGALEVE